MIYDILDEKLWETKCPHKMSPQLIVVHNTANDASAAQEISYMKQNPAVTGFHVAVDDKEAIQAIPFDRNAWHAGDGENGRGNRMGIGIEICYSKSGGKRFEMAEENAARLIAEILKERKWTIDRVKKHQDFSGKLCPHRTIMTGWDRFIKKVKKYMTDELTEVNDIVWELAQRGIITDKELWLTKLEEDEDAYWLARKVINYIREM